MTLRDPEEQASEAFVRRRFGPWTPEDQTEWETRIETDPAYADAFRRVEQSWAAVGTHAASAELMGLREQAISRARRASARRWIASDKRSLRYWRMAAVVGAVAVALGSAYQFSPFGYKPGEYRTRIGEQRVVELEDHSRVALDAATRMRVAFSRDARTVQLLGGQAQFSVVKDPGRAFKVEAGGHTVIAVGTAFTVEYSDRQMHVAMLEGKVAVVLQNPAAAQSPAGSSSTGVEGKSLDARQGTIELIAGEELRIRENGAPIVGQADLEAATAWREGKVVFRNELLGEAVHRLNRYSRLQLEIDDPALASMRISGVFEAGDTQAFAYAVQSYLPLTADYSDARIVRLKVK